MFRVRICWESRLEGQTAAASFFSVLFLCPERLCSKVLVEIEGRTAFEGVLSIPKKKQHMAFSFFN